MFSSHFIHVVHDDSRVDNNYCTVFDEEWYEFLFQFQGSLSLERQRNICGQ